MGMYDSIINELFCPFCGEKLKPYKFQTKDFGCSLSGLDIFKIKGISFEIYTTCSNCNNWINLNIGDAGVHTIEEGKKQIEGLRKEIKRILNGGLK